MFCRGGTIDESLSRQLHASQFEFYRSDDAGVSWTQESVPADPNFGGLSAVAADPTAPRVVWGLATTFAANGLTRVIWHSSDGS